MLTFLLIALCVAAAYALGSLCSAVIVCKMAKLPDPRTKGSKNPGATNVLRIAGKQYAALVFIADMLKGLLPIWIAIIFQLNPFWQAVVGLVAVLGHMYPVFFDFKGGKGVATSLGVLLGLHPLLGIMAMLTWITVAFFSRYSSLASIVTITLSPFYALLAFNEQQAFFPLVAIALAVLYQHKDNMKRLLDSSESKLDFNFGDINFDKFDLNLSKINLSKFDLDKLKAKFKQFNPGKKSKSKKTNTKSK
ncbi:MAG: glycerol-3-phosphate 1-O-acyltransferase PlsY [Legionella sp.]|nr:glycerol-3-phosphate 1-O-acyltransferase PlsY [Legionella sp.]